MFPSVFSRPLMRPWASSFASPQSWVFQQPPADDGMPEPEPEPEPAVAPAPVVAVAAPAVPVDPADLPA
ncbi:MAG: hypothetical protein ACM3PC_02070 [Deltaproteobacteria bacterium]